MKISRRTMMLGAGVASGGLGSAGKILGGGMAKAATELAWATYLDGASGFANPGGIAGMAQSNVGLFVYSWRSTSPPNFSGGRTIMHLGLPSSGIDHYCAIDHLIGGDSTPQLQIGITGTQGRLTFAAWTPIGSFYDGNWHTNVISIDSSNNHAAIVIDAVSVPVTTSIRPGDTYVRFQGATNIGENGTWSYIGDLTDIAVFAGGAFVDPTTIVDAIYDAESRFARRNASNGYGIIPNRRPQIWLSGPPNSFKRNLAAGTWTWPATYNDTNPTSDFTLVGNPQTATSDPFEPGSPF